MRPNNDIYSDNGTTALNVIVHAEETAMFLLQCFYFNYFILRGEEIALFLLHWLTDLHEGRHASGTSEQIQLILHTLTPLGQRGSKISDNLNVQGA